MKTILRIFPWLLVTGLDFWILPLFLNESNVLLMILIVMPGICFFSSLFCGILCGFRPLYLLGTEVLYLPTVWVYYSTAALGYMGVYAVTAVLGLGIGVLLRVGRKQTL